LAVPPANDEEKRQVLQKVAEALIKAYGVPDKDP
jgi:phenylpyruvate tautomerase PptA (4-oxalocrotonate tautomerase family)